MKVKFLKSLLWVAAISLAAACKPDINVNPPSPVPPQPTPEPTVVTEPAPCDNKIVAHRGGAAEANLPDNSLAALKYAMGLKVYAMECDIYWTKDNNIVIAHADGNYKINGLLPWEHTLDELRKAGNLKNGEQLPCLEDFLKTVMVEGNCTRLCLDIKYTSPNAYASQAVARACEIIKSKSGEKFCEFICTSNTTTAKTAASCMVSYKIPVGWMANSGPSTYKSYGFTWANLSTDYLTKTGPRTIDEFVNAGMQVSVFNVDKEGSTDSNATSDNSYYIDNYSKLRCICTNYPKWLKNQLK
ncbi:MAG: glycerophosphodiester phosphodiesterase [Bacteroidales bacterium]|nr:glycerophosphodiester phosphodiesterase [Bacteroidales bacterium]